MTTCSVIREKVENGEWSALDGAKGLFLALGDDYIPGVSPSAHDPDFWRLLALLVERGGQPVGRLIKAIVSLVVSL